MSYFFFLYRSPSSALCTVFDSISSNIDEVLLINRSANVFVFGDLTPIIMTVKLILVELIGLVNSVTIFVSQNDHIQMVNLPTQIPDCDSQSPVLFSFIYFY